MVKPDGFAADLHRKPEVLNRLAAVLADGNPWATVVPPGIERVVLLGMGSSAYAGGVAAARMRARGLIASSELASSHLLPGWEQATLVVATSASGGSAETLDALGRLHGSVHTVALTNSADSAITQRCDAVVDLAAEPEAGGVACRSYQHTLALLLALECQLADTDTAVLATAVAASATATAHLLDTETDWRPELSELLLGPSGTHLAAPAHRFCSAQQGALMLRDGPRLILVPRPTHFSWQADPGLVLLVSWKHVVRVMRDERVHEVERRLTVVAADARDKLPDWIHASGHHAQPPLFLRRRPRRFVLVLVRGFRLVRLRRH